MTRFAYEVVCCLIYWLLLLSTIGACALAVHVIIVRLEPLDEAYRRAVALIVAAYGAGDSAQGESLAREAGKRYWKPYSQVMFDVEDVACFGVDLSKLSAGPF